MYDDVKTEPKKKGLAKKNPAKRNRKSLVSVASLSREAASI